MKASEIRQLPPEELKQRLNDLKDDLFRLKFQLISGQLQNFRRTRQVRRDIARVLTIIKERGLQRSVLLNNAPTAKTSATAGEDASTERLEE